MKSVSPERICEFEDCGEKHYALGWCSRHYQQAIHGGGKLTPRLDRNRLCSFSTCQEKQSSKGLCRRHYGQKMAGTTLSLIAPLETRICGFPECGRAAKSLGWCGTHYAQLARGKEQRAIMATGQWHKNSYGYIVRSYAAAGAVGAGSTLQHRLIMAESIGRPLTDSENVHHINGVRDDNRIENLELWSKSQPAGQRVQDKADWAVEILRLYRPEVLLPEITENMPLAA